MSTLLRRAAAAVAATTMIAGLTACGSDDSEPKDEPTKAAAEPSDEPEEEGEAASEGTPAWAVPAVVKGDKITTIELGDVTVDVYQVGTQAATETGNFVDPDTNQPLIAVGDELVFLNYVITNTGDPIQLGSSIVSVDARYDDWPYMQGMDGVTDDALLEALGIHDDSLAPGGFNEAGIYTLGTGESYSYADNFKHQAGSPITFEAKYVPVDAEGELLHDEAVEAEGKGTIK